MTKEEMRELDAWIAEHGFNTYMQRDSNGRPYNAFTKVGEALATGQIPHFTRKPAAFAAVKREIERRGWSWQCRAIMPELVSYCFIIIKGWMGNVGPGELATVVAGTEEIAGCLAFKAAVEATDGDDTD